MNSEWYYNADSSRLHPSRPKDGDYRVQFQFGGTNETVEVRDEWIEAARACIAAAPALPDYARVDGVI